MTWTDWEDAYARQTDSVREQLNLMANLPSHRRKQLRLLEYICTACQGTILEVLATSPRIVIGHGVAIPENKYPSKEQRDTFAAELGRRPRVADWQRFFREQVDWSDEAVRREDVRKFHAIPDDFETLGPNPAGHVFYACKCHQWDLPQTAIAADLNNKVKKRSWNPRHAES